MKTKLLILSILLTGSISYAQSTVYLCANTGAIGYCYGNNNTGDCAFNKCVEYGGTAPHVILNTSNKGYGSIAKGKIEEYTIKFANK